MVVGLARGTFHPEGVCWNQRGERQPKVDLNEIKPILTQNWDVMHSTHPGVSTTLPPRLDGRIDHRYAGGQDGEISRREGNWPSVHVRMNGCARVAA